MTEQSPGLWKREADFTDEDRRVADRLRRHVSEAQSDECVLWIAQVVSKPRLAREEAALQRRMGRIPRDRPLLLEIHDEQRFENELVALQVERMMELAPAATGRGDAMLDPSVPPWARAGTLDPPAERPYRVFASWVVHSGAWGGAYLLGSALLRSCS